MEERQQCEYTSRKGQTTGFDEEAIGQLLCFPGHDFARSMAGKRLQIMCTNMTTLTQILMTFLLNNVLPSDHNSDLTLPKCQLVYSIMEHIIVCVAQLISDVIHQFVIGKPHTHPVHPDKSNKALDFPALITGLCQFYGVLVTPTKLIRSSINRSFIDKYCMPRLVQQPEKISHLS